MREVLPALVICLLYCVGRTLSAPGRSAGEVLIGEVDIAMRGDEDDAGGGGGSISDDDSPEATTEQPFAKKCFVNNKAYSHSQMIPSRDQSSHCLCVAGEVYCWWQTYGGPASTTGAPEDRPADSWTTEEDDYSPFAEGPSESPEEEDFSGESSGEQLDDNSVDSEELTEEQENEDEDEDESLESNDLPVANGVGVNSTSATTTTTPSTTTTSTTSRAPATCLVMGRTYQEGEVLPHSTGNCVECSCGSESRIECSPRDCVSLRPQNPGGGDLELFDFERDQSLDGSF